MAFYNYILLAVIFLLIVFLALSSKLKLIQKRWLKRTVNIVTTIIIVLLTCAVVLFPNFDSVKTTGKYPYTSCVIELTDTSRIEEHKADGSPRKLSALVYYPSDDGIPSNSCPLIVFSHGGISTNTSNLSLYKELASHGYVVVSIDHTYHAIATEIDGKKIYIDSGYMRELTEEDSHKDIENSYKCFQKWMQLRTDDINFIIDTFIEESQSKSDSFCRLINTSNIGLAGHSLGGSAALGVARQRGDIKAVIALESPYMYDIIGVDGNEFIWNTDPYRCAVMNIYSDSGYSLIETDNKYIQNKNHLQNNGDLSYYLAGSNHYTLTDLVRTSPVLCTILGGSYKKSGYDSLKFINQKSLEFFDEHLR
jgi:dienelactone hydrolase